MVYDINKNKNILLAAKLIINGNLIIYSTDTLYGFGVDASNTSAIKKLNQIKGRSQAYSIIVSSFEMLKKYANMDIVIENATGLKVQYAEDPLSNVALGSGKVMKNLKSMKYMLSTPYGRH